MKNIHIINKAIIATLKAYNQKQKQYIIDKIYDLYYNKAIEL